MANHYDVIVAGGGMSGLRTARDLGAAGKSVLVLEAQDRLGGRLYYERFAETDTLVELGGGWFNLAYQPELAAEIERYSIPTMTNEAGSALVRWHENGSIREGNSPVPLEYLGELERALFASYASAQRIEFGTAWDAQDVADLDISWEEYIRNLGVSEPVAEWLRTWPSSSAPEDTSTLHLLTWVAGFGPSLWRTYAEGMLFTFERGTKSLIDALAEDSGAEIRLSTPIARFEQDDDVARVVTRSGEVFTAGAVVVAIPFNVWQDAQFEPALSQAKHDASSQLPHSGMCLKLWVTLKNAPEEGVLGWGMGPGLNWFFRTAQTPEGDLYVGFNGGNELDSTDRAAVERAVHAYIPEAEVVSFDAHDWRTNEFEKGAWMVQRPGHRAFHTALAEREGRLIFGGSDVSFGWNGWMEGALEAGGRAAREALDVLRAG